MYGSILQLLQLQGRYIGGGYCGCCVGVCGAGDGCGGSDGLVVVVVGYQWCRIGGGSGGDSLFRVALEIVVELREVPGQENLQMRVFAYYMRISCQEMQQFCEQIYLCSIHSGRVLNKTLQGLPE